MNLKCFVYVEFETASNFPTIKYSQVDEIMVLTFLFYYPVLDNKP